MESSSCKATEPTYVGRVPAASPATGLVLLCCVVLCCVVLCCVVLCCVVLCCVVLFFCHIYLFFLFLFLPFLFLGLNAVHVKEQKAILDEALS